jgi:lipopolysaccharide transport system permease protein
MNKTQKEEIIRPNSSFFDLNLKEIWRYKDLLFLFVRRDFVAVYKQTILGPLWFIIQPIFTTLVFTVVFGQLASIPTDGLPQVLFYMCGITCWNYFAECVTKTSNTFVTNSAIFGKVYFPRLILPLSVILTNLLKFGIQFLLFLAIFFYYIYSGSNISPNIYIFTLPLLLFIMATLGLGFGLIISSLTTKYRDFQFLISFGIQLFMYATPIVYPLSLAKEKLGAYGWIATVNPMTSIIETMKFAFLGEGVFSWNNLAFSLIFSLVLLFLGVIVFNRVEKTFMDTV